MEMTINQKSDFWELLFNPFVRIAGFHSLVYGLIAIAISAMIGYINAAHFDGVLDFHVGRNAPIHVFFIQGLMNWLILSFILFVCGITLSKSKIRLIDVFGTQALARWPMLILTSIVFIPFFNNTSSTSSSGVLQIISYLIIIWMVSLMYNAYKISCNLRGTKLIASFIGGLISAEILSKIIIVQFVFGMLAFPSGSQAASIPIQEKEGSIKIANDILTSLKEENYEQASIAFDDNMKTKVTPLKLKQVWSSMVLQSGNFQKTIDTKVSERNGNDVVLMVCQFEKAKFNMTTAINNKNEVIGLLFQPYQAPTKTIEVTEEELKKYLGVYSSPTFPLKVTITNNGNNLIGQATGQPSFQLECFEEHKFKFDQAGLKLEFIPNESKMILLQGGGRFEMKRE